MEAAFPFKEIDNCVSDSEAGHMAPNLRGLRWL